MNKVALPGDTGEELPHRSSAEVVSDGENSYYAARDERHWKMLEEIQSAQGFRLQDILRHFPAYYPPPRDAAVPGSL